MGEIIQTYGNIKIKEKLYDIELNDPISKESGGIVHIQNSDIRMEMSQVEFYQIVGILNLAKTNLEKMKGLEEGLEVYE